MTDDYGNLLDTDGCMIGDHQTYCSYPDCGCDGKRNCDAKNGPNKLAAWNCEMQSRINKYRKINHDR